jgi:hypothetical protein
LSHTLRILDADDPGDLADWLALWKSWPQREVFAHPHYVALSAEEGQRVLCAVVAREGGFVLYPFILRDLTRERYWPPDAASGFDITSPYAFGGPFAWGDVHGGLVQAFWSAFDGWAKDKGLVSEFIRFALFPGEALPYPGEREQILKDVVRDLSLTGDAMLMDFEHKVRKNIKKAERSGVTIVRDASGERLEEFLVIYRHTLDRREADRRYYFPRAFFERIQRDLSGQFMYFHALHAGRVVSTELVLVSEENVYSFLGGTDDAFDLRPNDLLKVEIIRWAQSAGKRRFVLGGGYQADDGIYRYKLSFAPHGVAPFEVGRRIFSRGMYERLVANRALQSRDRGEVWAPSPEFFPAYRA